MMKLNNLFALQECKDLINKEEQELKKIRNKIDPHWYKVK